jgi:predicted ATPase
MPGFDRPFSARELSDGTLQYLCLLAALLTPRPPNLMVLNEPETSIHPDLFGPLAALIVAAGKRSQLIVTTHAHELATHIKNAGDVQAFELEKVDGETRVVGAKLSDYEEDTDEDENEV